MKKSALVLSILVLEQANPLLELYLLKHLYHFPILHTRYGSASAAK